MDCPDPRFAGSNKPGTDRPFFPSVAHFSALSAGTFQVRKSVTAVKFTPQRYLKGIIKWYCHRVPYLS
ncbi:hypothetical protein CKO_00686 [Citrobacter koseri ATCC BAA-895]|uniref:Uncharacterized protein n=1 Tax=Citrobacter koseri (strain ATCC BAA-895 / CDC 4225-83 / SGSC4696) TaxID=290338 RepID=A8AEC7_CITK8|nr:hypothetical protein CKO_00686 [Citrobacter koseri ATCC BAA-895]